MTSTPELPEGVGELIEERLRERAHKEDAHAGKVQGPAVVGTQWGADIIEGHERFAAELREAADVIASLREENERRHDALRRIAIGAVPPDQHGHYLAHRAAVKIARQALTGSACSEGEENGSPELPARVGQDDTDGSVGPGK